MNRKDLVAAMAEGAQISKTSAESALAAFVDAIKSALKEDEKVSIFGFGTFTVSKRAARQGRNPKTGETIQIAASKRPKFSPGKDFKEAVR